MGSGQSHMRWLIVMTAILVYSYARAEPPSPEHLPQLKIEEVPQTAAGSGDEGPEPKIIDGEEASDTSFDHIVGILFRQKGKEQVCTGVAVSTSAILTAGHCTCGQAGSYRVIRGPHIRRDIRAELKVSFVRPMPGYECKAAGSAQGGLDLGLIGLVKPDPELAPLIPKVALVGDAMQREAPPEDFTVFGYGRTETGAIGERRRAEVPVSSFTCLERRWARTGCAPFTEFILSAQGTRGRGGRSARRDSCSGDSGGPAFWMLGDDFLLVGIVSRGYASPVRVAGLPCGGGGIYSNVGRHSVLNWLESEGVTVCTRTGACAATSPPASN